MMRAFVCLSITIVIFSSFTSDVETLENWKKANLRVIIRSDIFQTYEWSKEVEPIAEPEDAKLKTTLCRNIFTTSFFRTHLGEDWFDTDPEENRAKLKNHISEHIFETMFEENKSLMNYWFPYLVYDVDEYKNRWKFMEIETNRSDDEFEGDYEQVFMCLVRVRPPSPNVFGGYYVSETCRVSFPDLDVTDIVGRFVYSGDNKRLKVVAFATDATGLCGESAGDGTMDTKSSQCRGNDDDDDDDDGQREFEMDIKSAEDLADFGRRLAERRKKNDDDTVRHRLSFRRHD